MTAAGVRVKCLSCHSEHRVLEWTATATETIVRISCPHLRVAAFATLLELPDGTPIDLVAEAKRIFADDLRPAIEPRQTAPDPPTLEELGLHPPTGNPPDEPPIRTPMEGVVVDDPGDHVQAAYDEWIATDEGREIAKAIRDRALELRRKGWDSYGIQAIAEVVRYDRSVRAGPDAAGFRVNNSHLSRLARDLMKHYPELGDFFPTRELRI